MYWLVSLPLIHGNKEDTWRALQSATGSGDLSQNHKVDLPTDLRVGSVDLLLTLSDDLVRINSMVEGVVNKIRRQANDLSGGEALLVNSRPVDNFLTSFSWDEAKYSSRKALKDIIESMYESVQAIDDDMKVKVQEFQAIKQTVAAANRKLTGSLAVKDLSLIVQPKDVINTENLMTLIVTIPRFHYKEWTATYESLAKFVVPRSAVTVAEDGDYVLQRVILFRRVLDDFRLACRGKGCQTREYALPEEGEEEAVQNSSAAANAHNVSDLEVELDGKKRELEAWCRNAYGEAFSAWIHICAVRLFAESVLRYGLPPSFQAALVAPHRRCEDKTRRELSKAFSTYGAQFWKEDAAAGAATEGELYPYVSFTLDLEA